MNTVAALNLAQVTFADIPWPLVILSGGILLAALEVRLSKAGFVKKSDLDGLSQRQDREMALAKNERDVNARAIVMIRTDLDATRDRVTHVESNFRALHDRVDEQVVKPIGRIEEKMDAFIVLQAHHDADIRNLKETVDKLKGIREGKGS